MREQKIQLLQEVMGKGVSSGKETLFYCKKCKHHKPKLSINIEKNKFKCWVCNFSGNSIFLLFKKYGSSEQIFQWGRLTGEINLAEKENLKSLIIDPKEEEIEISFELPKEFISLVGNFDLSSNRARNYLHSRGIQEKDINKWRMGYAQEGEYQNRIIIPSFNVDGKINYFVSRTYVDDFPKYKNPPSNKNIIFNWLFVDFKKPLVLVEGVFDALKVEENVVPILGSTLTEKSQLFHEIVKHNTPCYLGLDPDARKKEVDIIKKLLLYDIEVCKIVISPFNDIGEMSKDVFLERKKNAIHIDREKFTLYQMLNQ